MKKIEAIIQPFMMTPVLDALHAIDGLSGVTTSEVHGLNMQALSIRSGKSGTTSA